MLIPIAYIGVIIIWSTTPLAIKWSSDAGFLFGVTSRMTLGLILCLAIIKLLKHPLPFHRQAKVVYVVAGVPLYLGMMSTYWAAQTISSGLIAVLFGLTPIATGVFSILILQQQHFTRMKLMGMLLGVVGLIVVFNRDLSLKLIDSVGVMGILFAVLMHSLSAVLVKNENKDLSGLSVASGSLMVATPLFLVTWLIFDGQWPEFFPLHSQLSIIYLGVSGSVIGFVLYYYLLKHVCASKVGLITLITPIIALQIGHQLNNEIIDFQLWLGTVIILSGLLCYQWESFR
ncbi:MAG: DMT family transporter [Methylococcales bacterium]|jgi:drug/metabolite transporter (DMT)-like permease|nr:DMT family transporter [Methylococcales bacterium]